MKPLAVTMGEPAGIGPELCLAALADSSLPPLAVIGDRAVLQQRAELLNLPFAAADYEEQPDAARSVWHTPAAEAPPPGQPLPANAGSVLQQLRQAADGCQARRFAAMVTAPVSKQAILAAGAPFVGQTEYIAAHIGAACPVMLLAAPTLRVALATTHLPLREVAAALRAENIVRILQVLHRDLPRHFATDDPPRIAMCALNPHAGEGGHLGDEEQRVLRPAVEQAQAQGIAVQGPFPADTLLARADASNSDCVLAMYHDQGLPVVKRQDFARTVNITLGLPFLRTSPDHGVALDIAAAGGADTGSMMAALQFAAARA